MRAVRERLAWRGTLRGVKASVHRGGLWAIALAFPLAAICALLYRFPQPMAGYSRGLSEMPLTIFAVIFYGLLGGFVVLYVVGGLGGAAAHAIGRPDERLVHRLALAFGGLTALISVVFMAELDKIIGPY